MMRTVGVLAALAMSACSLDDSREDSQIDPWTGAPPVAIEDLEAVDIQAGPPGAGGFTLDVDGNLEPGSPITWTASGVPPGAPVWFFYGPNDLGSQNGACPPQLAAASLCLDIFPAYLGYAFADPSGTATLSLTVPPNPNGFALAFQAVLLAGPNSATSNTERRYNADPRDTNDTGFNGILIGAYLGAGVYNSASGGFDGVEEQVYYDGAYWNTSVQRDICRLRNDVTAPAASGNTVAPCSTCAFQFTADFTPTLSDATEWGDCLDYLNLDPTTASSFEWSYGYDAASGQYLVFDSATGLWGVVDYGLGAGVASADPASGLFEYSSIFGLYYW